MQPVHYVTVAYKLRLETMTLWLARAARTLCHYGWHVQSGNYQDLVGMRNLDKTINEKIVLYYGMGQYQQFDDTMNAP